MNHLANETSPTCGSTPKTRWTGIPGRRRRSPYARAENRRTLLSIGYRACHWCHDMAHESFEHEPTAALMNSLYVNIKVDREERPDLDDTTCKHVQAHSRAALRWPMTVFPAARWPPVLWWDVLPTRAARWDALVPAGVQLAVNDAYKNRREMSRNMAADLTKSLHSATCSALVGWPLT